MPRLWIVSLTAVVLVAAGGASARPAAGRAASAVPATTFAMIGRGWGHGIGMSQYGARGFAERGATYSQILAHYYPGTQLGQAPVARVRVLLADRKKVLTIGSERPFRVRDASGKAYQLPAGALELRPGLELPVGEAPQQLAGPLAFATAGAPLELNGRAYRGSIEVSVEKNRLRAINSVGLEGYLYGVVPDEMPEDWPVEALKAQAVVARSYALAVRKSGPFDLYADVRSQVYNGVDAEEPQTTAAVDQTVAEVLLYDGAIATTYFFSTSGGRTANIEDVWDSEPVPYLVAVDDPYDSASPYHRWGPVPFTAERLAKAFKVAGPILDARTTVNLSRRTDALVLVTAAGDTDVSPAAVRAKLGLRSTWFRVGVLSLTPPERPVAYGVSTQLAGIARGFKGVKLEQRALGSLVWEPAAAIKVAADGTFALPVKPVAPAYYRLSAGTLRSAPLRLAVAPLVRLLPPVAPGALLGKVRPALEGATVVVQRQDGGVWTTVGRATVDAEGGFEAQLELLPGTYRARFAPGRGFAAGLSAVLNVVPA